MFSVVEFTGSPASRSADRWTFFRRLSLLLRTVLDDEGTTLSLHQVAERTHGRLTADELRSLLEAGPLAQSDPVTEVLLAQAFGIDPDFFVADSGVQDYINGIRSAYATLPVSHDGQTASLQQQALALFLIDRDPALTLPVR